MNLDTLFNAVDNIYLLMKGLTGQVTATKQLYNHLYWKPLEFQV
jgi:hypothetical protein